MTPTVSVVIPTYNRAPDLARALASVCAQTHADWEALVVDNHSTDGTAALIADLGEPRIRYLTIHNHGVIAASRNVGIREAEGEFIAFLDSDDMWVPAKLDKAVGALRQGYDFVYHDMRVISQSWFDTGPRTYRTHQLLSPVQTDLLVRGNTVPTSSVVARTSLLRDVGGFREDTALIAGEDFDLWIRLGAVTHRFKRLDGTLGLLTRGHASEFSARRLLSVIGEVEREYLPRLSSDERAQAHARWIDYAYARCLYKQRDYRAARPHLLRVLSSSPSPGARARACCMLAVMSARGMAGFAH